MELGRKLEEEHTTVVLAFGPSRDLYLALGEGLTVQNEQVGKTLLRSYSPAEAAAAAKQLLAMAAEAACGCELDDLFAEWVGEESAR